MPEGAARLGAVARGEERVLDAERHDVHARGVGVVEAHELLGLDLATREHRVGAGEDRRLLEGAVLGLGLEVSAFTRSRVWKVMMSGMFSSCFRR